jgi:carotenoid 1,2-hydratase
MTERRQSSLAQSPEALSIGRSSFVWRADRLAVAIDEWASPIPRRIRGRIEVYPAAVVPRRFPLDAARRHWWRPIAPRARVIVAMERPDLRWSGEGYLDHNAGAEPLEAAFSSWTWSRASLPDDSASVLYDAVPRNGAPTALALRFAAEGIVEALPPLQAAPLPRTVWGLKRSTRSDDGAASLVRPLEDTPFYARALVAHVVCGRRVVSVHESLSLDRFARPLVRLMLPFRMPRI